MTTEVLVLVEPGAHRPGGHRHRTLTALAHAHANAVVVAPYGVTAETASALATAKARVAVRPYGAVATALLAAGTTAASLATTGRRVFASRRWPTAARRVPHQITLLARCLTEAACVRTAHRLAGGRSTVVVLSASEALHGLVGLLGGAHTRFVHELVTTEDAPLRALGTLARSGERRAPVLAPTGAVRDELIARFPHLPVQVRPFAVADPGDRLTDAERQQARDDFGVPADETAVCLVGGWWPGKDPDVHRRRARPARGSAAPAGHRYTARPADAGPVDRPAAPAAAHRPRTGHQSPGPRRVRGRRRRAGHPPPRRGQGVRAGDRCRPLRRPADHLRPRPGPDHPSGREDWARQFSAGDAAGLATVLDDLTQAPPPRPSPQAAALLAVPTAANQIAFLTRTKPKESRRWPSRLY